MYFQSKKLSALGLTHGFTHRLGGVSLPPYDSLNLGFNCGDQPVNVETNLKLLATRIQARAENFFWLRQEAGNKIVAVENEKSSAIRQQLGDALLSNQRSALLSIRTADCLPVLLADEKRKYVAAVHVGWRGAFLEILPKTIAQLKARGVNPANLIVAMGPCLGPCCLRLGPEVVQSFQKKFKTRGRHAFKKRKGDHGMWLNLWEFSKNAAIAQGVKQKNIEILDTCTFCTPQWYFSYRRDGAIGGRHLSFISV